MQPGHIVPHDPQRANRQLGRLWEQFIGGGQLRGADVPRPVILESWQRSRERGINPITERAVSQIAIEEISHLLATQALGQSGVNVMRAYADIIQASGHVIVLADAHGRILHSVGDRNTRDHLERINFCPGGMWAEELVGPNGIGTVLTQGRPEVVFGAEHYCRAWQPWVCYGSPVRDPDNGEMLGAVDITGPMSQANIETMALTMAISQSIEHNLQKLAWQDRERLRQQYRDLERRWHNDGLLLLSKDGRILDINHRAMLLLGLAKMVVMNQPLDSLHASLGETVRALGNGRGERFIETTLAAEQAANSLRVQIEPVYRDNQLIGRVLVLIDKGSVATAPASGSGEPRATRATHNPEPCELIGHARSFREALNLVHAAAQDVRENPVLLTGESGTGKELIAKSIHARSKRRAAPLVILNCGVLPASLAETELFGYVFGAFTGAHRTGCAGKFESADGGTLFIDEMDSLPLELQVKFLRALEERQITRVGSVKPVAINVRVIAATGSDLRKKVAAGEFRTDLFHRLAVIEIDLPPLRQRVEDIELLARHFLEQACLDSARACMDIAPEVLEYTRNYAWPGNVRELRNVCERWVLMVSGDTVQVRDLPSYLLFPAVGLAEHKGGIDSNAQLHEIEDALIRKALQETNGCVTRAATRLGINRTTIYRRMKRWTES